MLALKKRKVSKSQAHCEHQNSIRHALGYFTKSSCSPGRLELLSLFTEEEHWGQERSHAFSKARG
jgi:hypothetical protein